MHLQADGEDWPGQSAHSRKDIDSRYGEELVIIDHIAKDPERDGRSNGESPLVDLACGKRGGEEPGGTLYNLILLFYVSWAQGAEACESP